MTLGWIVESSQLTDVGRKREHNEDFVGCFEPGDPQELAAYGRLYLVADGVGGAASGEEASRYAVQRILYDFYSDSEPDLLERLVMAIEDANADIFEHNAWSPDGREMATTVVAALVHGQELVVASVGDSRVYLVRQGVAEQITRDHSLVARLVDQGMLTPEEAERHPQRNVILRGLGMDEVVDVDCFTRPLAPDDVVVLCSDGLTRYVADDEITDVVGRHSAEAAARELVDMANARGGRDNISVSVVRILDAERGTQ